MSILRTVIVAISIVLFPYFGSAQQIHVLVMVDVSEISLSAQKHLRETAHAFEPSATVSFHDAQVKLKFMNDVDPAILLEHVNAIGVGTFEYVQRPDDMLPHRSHTADPAADEAEYQSAKAQWIEQHPEQYSRIVNGNEFPSSVVPTPEK